MLTHNPGSYPFNGNTNDESGHGYNLTNYGAVLTTDRFGDPQSAYYFNGTSSLSIPFSPTSALFPPNGPLSISLWFNSSNNQANVIQMLVCGAAYPEIDTLYGYEIYLGYGGINFFIPGFNILTSFSVTDGKWHNAVAILDDIGTMYLYVDGALAGQESTSGVILYDTSAEVPFVIGASYNGTEGLTGDIDDIRIYNRALTTSEVNELYTGTALGGGTTYVWEYVRIGDCADRDTRGSLGSDTPVSGFCDDSHVGTVAVCWDGQSNTNQGSNIPQCAYKGIDPGSCTGGGWPGFMYVCVPVGAPLTITTPTLPIAASGTPYTTTLMATGGSGIGYTWSVSQGSGPLPPGFTLDPTTGVLSTTGSPVTPASPPYSSNVQFTNSVTQTGNQSALNCVGSYSFTVEVTDSAGNTAPQPLTLAISCPFNLNVSNFPAGQYMWAKFVAPNNKTLSDCENACGYSSFNWQQMITTLPSGYFWPNDPSEVPNNIDPLDGSLYAPPSFFDPPYGGYTTYLQGYDGWPLYYLSNQVAPPNQTGTLYCTLAKGQCPSPFPYIVSPDDTTLWFVDDPALAGDATPGDFIAFKTSLVGVDNQGKPNTLYFWTWKSTFTGTAINGTGMKVSQTASIYPINPSSGTGGVTITSINGVPVTRIAACNGATFTGDAMVDSYYSVNGSYASQVVAGHAGSDGNVQTCAAGANITLSGNAAVYGNASATGSVTTSGNAKVSGVVSQNQPTSACDPLNVVSLVANNIPSGSPTGISLSGNKTKTLAAPGTFYLSGVNLSGNSVLTVSGTGNATMFIDGNLSISGKASFIVSNGVSLTIYITGNISIDGGGILNQGPPTDLIIYASAEKGSQVTISGNSEFSGALYAPLNNISVTGNSTFMGAVKGMTVTGSGNAGFHYDEDTGPLLSGGGRP